MGERHTNRQLIPLLTSSIRTYLSNPIIALPFITLTFIQLLIIEILYFAVRNPLSSFFNPVINRLWGEIYIHYPFNFVIIPKLFQYTEYPTVIFISSFYVCVAIAIISLINNNKKINLSIVYREVSQQYVHIFLAALLSFGIFWGSQSLYSLLILKAWGVSSIKGPFYILKTAVLEGTPYFFLLISILVTTAFSFVFPIIVIEKKRITHALYENFSLLKKSWKIIFFVILIPMMAYVPVMLLRNNLAPLAEATFPEVRIIILIASVIIITWIDLTIYTAITTYYLLIKEYP